MLKLDFAHSCKIYIGASNIYCLLRKGHLYWSTDCYLKTLGLPKHVFFNKTRKLKFMYRLLLMRLVVTLRICEICFQLNNCKTRKRYRPLNAPFLLWTVSKTVCRRSLILINRCGCKNWGEHLRCFCQGVFISIV